MACSEHSGLMECINSLHEKFDALNCKMDRVFDPEIGIIVKHDSRLSKLEGFVSGFKAVAIWVLGAIPVTGLVVFIKNKLVG